MTETTIAIARHLHLTAVALTFLFFIIRFVLLLRASPALDKKWLKITPHIADTLLLISIIWMAIIYSAYPFLNSWATAKFAGLIFYVGSIVVALRVAKKTHWRILAAISAVFWLVMTARLGFVGMAAFA
uniref:SirB2 family protein n=1 Tax=Ningiella ruwaisensis TaxID=2364274 RepID=UPI0010A0BE9B|nr:SirB2 family protein [Ningiella ruwaisensis]